MCKLFLFLFYQIFSHVAGLKMTNEVNQKNEIFLKLQMIYTWKI